MCAKDMTKFVRQKFTHDDANFKIGFHKERGEMKMSVPGTSNTFYIFLDYPSKYPIYM